MIMYIWFGVGSVPWIGQGKYVLAQLLFLFAGVIITHQLDVMYVLILAAIIVTDPHLTHLSHTYSVWSLCAKGVPYVGTLVCMYFNTSGLIIDKGSVGRQVLIPRKEQSLLSRLLWGMIVNSRDQRLSGRLQLETRLNRLLEPPGIPIVLLARGNWYKQMPINHGHPSGFRPGASRSN